MFCQRSQVAPSLGVGARLQDVVTGGVDSHQRQQILVRGRGEDVEALRAGGHPRHASHRGVGVRPREVTSRGTRWRARVRQARVVARRSRARSRSVGHRQRPVGREVASARQARPGDDLPGRQDRARRDRDGVTRVVDRDGHARAGDQGRPDGVTDNLRVSGPAARRRDRVRTSRVVVARGDPRARRDQRRHNVLHGLGEVRQLRRRQRHSIGPARTMGRR